MRSADLARYESRLGRPIGIETLASSPLCGNTVLLYPALQRIQGELRTAVVDLEVFLRQLDEFVDFNRAAALPQHISSARLDRRRLR
ncbi:MAG: hypothetical protein ACFB5Z_21085 [Elainellaceae cyanobacterium]